MSDQVQNRKRGIFDRFLGVIEKLGNLLPDPAALFVIALIATWVVSAFADGTQFSVPSKTGDKVLQITSQVTPDAMIAFLTSFVKTFTGFAPLGVVLVAMLGLGVADKAGFVNAGIKTILGVTPRKFLTPVVILVGLLSLLTIDAGYVLVIPIGGVIFYTAGRHPLAGIAAGFAAVSGGFCANFVPTALDLILMGLTAEGAAVLDPAYDIVKNESIPINPLCNYFFTIASSVVIVLLGWFVTDRIVEPRLKGMEVDGDEAEMPKMEKSTKREKVGLVAGLVSMGLILSILGWFCFQEDSVFADKDGNLASSDAPIFNSFVPLIFVLFLVPGILHGYIAGTFKSHRDVVQAMVKTMNTMGYYIVIAFCASLFIFAFKASQIGSFLSVSGANFIKSMSWPAPVTVIAIILTCCCVNILVGSSSAKWTMLAPIFVPMLMQLEISPELTQAAYRVGDSTTNIITPLNPYFPLIVLFCQRYYTKTGIGTLISIMLPYTLIFLVTWTIFLVAYWQLGLPLGVDASYVYQLKN